MKKNYQNKNHYNREGGDNRDSRRRNNEGASKDFRNDSPRDHRKKIYDKPRENGDKNNRRPSSDNPKFVDKPSVQTGKFSLTKSINGFLVISLFVREKANLNSLIRSIETILEVDHKKKLIISFEKPSNNDLASSLKKRFEGGFGIFFFNSKNKLSGNTTQISSKIHTEVLNAFKSHFFLTLDSSVTLKQFSLEKMLNFLSKPTDTIAVSPKFYTEKSEVIRSCKRFIRLWNFLPPFNNFLRSKQIEQIMMERGEIGYYSIHRVDYSSLNCMLFLTEGLLQIKAFSSRFKSEDLRDASLCKKLSKKTGGKIMFYPHARVLSSSEQSFSDSSNCEKLKYLVCGGA